MIKIRLYAAIIFKALFNLSSRKRALSYDENYVLLSNERSEVKNK